MLHIPYKSIKGACSNEPIQRIPPRVRPFMALSVLKKLKSKLCGKCLSYICSNACNPDYLRAIIRSDNLKIYVRNIMNTTHHVI